MFVLPPWILTSLPRLLFILFGLTLISVYLYLIHTRRDSKLRRYRMVKIALASIYVIINLCDVLGVMWVRQNYTYLARPVFGLWMAVAAAQALVFVGLRRHTDVE